MTKTPESLRRVSIRLSPEMKSELIALAESEKRTLSNYIILKLQEIIDSNGKPKSGRHIDYNAYGDERR